MKQYKALKDFSGSNFGYDVVYHKKGDVFTLSDELAGLLLTDGTVKEYVAKEAEETAVKKDSKSVKNAPENK